MARGMVMRWGMSEKIGPVALEESGGNFLGSQPSYPPGAKPYSEATASLADAEVHRIVSESWQQAVELLSKYRNELEALTRALLEQETLDEQDVLEITGLEHV